MNDPVGELFQALAAQLQQIQSDPSLLAAAAAVAEAIANDRGYFLFGSGHSALVAQEAFWRAGGLAPALPIHDPTGGDAERLNGMAAVLLARYDLKPGDVLLLISNSGINSLPVELALEARARGVTVIAITCVEHTRAVESRHPSGKKLADLADIVIDTHGRAGDAVVDLGNGVCAGATSTIVGCAIVEAITVKAALLLRERGLEPPVLMSANLPEGDAYNRKLARRYRPRLIRFEIPGVDAQSCSSLP